MHLWRSRISIFSQRNLENWNAFAMLVLFFSKARVIGIGAYRDGSRVCLASV